MTYVLSDIHGNQRRFNSIMEQISLQPEDTLYILGDVIDRHPYGIKLLRQIMAIPNAKMLLGNHEYMMLRALGDPYDGREDVEFKAPESLVAVWYRNGGDVTHAAWKHTRKSVRAEILEYLKSLPLNIDVTLKGQQFKLVHAAVVEMYEKLYREPFETRTHFAVWDRDTVLYTDPKDITIVFGHTPTHRFQSADPLRIWHHDNLIGIDCGSGFLEAPYLPPGAKRGRLACLRLEDMREFYSDENL